MLCMDVKISSAKLPKLVAVHFAPTTLENSTATIPLAALHPRRQEATTVNPTLAICLTDVLILAWLRMNQAFAKLTVVNCLRDVWKCLFLKKSFAKPTSALTPMVVEIVSSKERCCVPSTHVNTRNV